MRTFLATLLLVACSVPDKSPSDNGDGGTDTLPDAPEAVPDTMITMAPAPFAATGASKFEFTATLANAKFECSIDGDSPMTCTSPYTRILPDGAHDFSVRAINKAGKGDDTPAEHLWLIDTVAPNTMMVSAPPPADNSVMVVFEFRSSEENVTFDCSLDGGGYVACVSGAMVGPVSDGSHSFAVRAHDRAGNIDSSPAIHAWSVDTSTPDTQLLSGPMGATGSTGASFTFISPDAGSGATFQCELDGGGLVGCASPYSVANLTEGTHTFSVRVRDAVGNFDPTPATRTWSVDLSPPETMIDSGPEAMVRIASAVFTFSSTEVGVTFECSLDGGGYAPCTSPQSYASLGQGAHGFSVRAIDAAMHVDATPATRAWTVDTIAPDVVITSGPAEASTSGPRVIFGFTVSDGAVMCSVDQGVYVACGSPFGTNLPAGAHDFRVRATDAAGNVTTVMRGWSIACAAPSTAGAAGLLHLDDSGQLLANATGGAAATLGTTDMVEAADPVFGTGRFGGDVVFTAGDVVAWPAALGTMADVTIELWVLADATGGLHDLFVSGDARAAVRASGVSPTTVRISATIGNGTPTSAPIAANVWHHVIASLSGATARLWVDGVRVDAAANGPGPSLDTITLGGTLGGAIDEVWVAQTAITDEEAALARYCPL